MKLKVRHNSVDYTLKMDNFNNAVKALNLTTEKIYIGYHKPLKNIYVEMTTRVATDSLSLKYYNGTEYVAVEALEDRTLGLCNSGLISWQEDEDDEAEVTTLGGFEGYWYELTTTGAPASVSIHGINLVLSNDNDFGFIPNVTDYLPDGKTSFISFHQEARDLIVQSIRNSGKKIINWSTLDPKQVDVFDLLNIEEFRNASKYMALHLLFDWLKKTDDDHYAIKAKTYHDRAIETVNSNLASIDQNDNGKTDEGESSKVQFVRIRRE